jgi:hypothetical protein
VHALGLGLDEKAIQALSTWRFRAGEKAGKPVAVIGTAEVNFNNPSLAAGGGLQPGQGVVVAISFAGTPPERDRDSLQESAKCATQAEMVIAGRGDMTFSDWEVHYSPKYKRCFLSIVYSSSHLAGARNLFAAFRWELMDVDERTDIAVSETDGPANPNVCRIEHKQAECERAKSFIDDHMKN